MRPTLPATPQGYITGSNPSVNPSANPAVTSAQSQSSLVATSAAVNTPPASPPLPNTLMAAADSLTAASSSVAQGTATGTPASSDASQPVRRRTTGSTQPDRPARGRSQNDHVVITMPEEASSASGQRRRTPSRPAPAFGFSYKKLFLGLMGAAVAGAGLQGLLARRMDQTTATGGLQPRDGHEPDSNAGAAGGYLQGAGETDQGFMARLLTPPSAPYTEADIPDYVHQAAFEDFLQRMPNMVECPALCNIQNQDGIVSGHSRLGVVFMEPGDSFQAHIWGDNSEGAAAAAYQSRSPVSHLVTMQERAVNAEDFHVRSREQGMPARTRAHYSGPGGQERFQTEIEQLMRDIANAEAEGGFLSSVGGTFSSVEGDPNVDHVSVLYTRMGALQEITDVISRTDLDNNAGMASFVQALNDELRAQLYQEIDRAMPNLRNGH